MVVATTLTALNANRIRPTNGHKNIKNNNNVKNFNLCLFSKNVILNLKNIPKHNIMSTYY